MKVICLIVCIYSIFYNVAFADLNKGVEIYKIAIITKDDMDHSKDKELIKVLNEWKPVAEKGDSKAQLYLGILYSERKVGWSEKSLGLVNEENNLNYNTEQALYWLKEAANNNFIFAQYVLGYLYMTDSNYVGINEKEAFYWLDKAVKSGSVDSKVLLADCYKFGFGTKKNKKEAARLFKEAYDYWKILADKGDIKAQKKLGDMVYRNQKGEKKNFPEALKYYISAARQGCLQSLTNLAYMYYWGEGVKKDIRKGIELFALGTEYHYRGCSAQLPNMKFNIKELGLKGFEQLLKEAKELNKKDYPLEFDIPELEDYTVKDPTIAQKIDDIIAGNYKVRESTNDVKEEEKKVIVEKEKITEPKVEINSEKDFWNTVDNIIKDSNDDNQNKQAIKYIQKNSSELVPKLLAKIKSTTDENTQNIYLWLLGFTKATSISKPLIELYNTSNIENIKDAIIMTLVKIGSIEVSEILMERYKNSKTEDEKFNYLNLLAQLKYKPALPLMDEILKKDPNQFYWQNNFIFGKYGDVCVPYLLEKINSKDKNIKYNSLIMLGKWLVAPEALKTFQDLFLKEKDLETRQMLLALTEGLFADLKKMEAYYKSVSEKESEEELKDFAKETIEEIIPKVKEEISEFSKRQPNPELFNQEYDKLLEGLGHGGDYEILEKNSLPENEEKLKILREVILQRNSDEAFYDYEHVTKIIILNRYLKANSK